MKEDSLFLEVDVAQCCKEGQRICGDSFLTRRVEGEGRIIVVLSDGLGSGVKAPVIGGKLLQQQDFSSSRLEIFLREDEDKLV